MRRLISARSLIASALMFCLFTSGPARAELATPEQMEQVCQNWLAYMVHESGSWAGSTDPEIVDLHEIVSDSGDMVMAHCFSISPQGHVVVPVLMELPPIKAYSEEYGLDVDQTVGFPQLLREVLEHRLNLFIERYGSLDATQPPGADVLFDRVNRRQWDVFLLEAAEFDDRLKNGGLRDREEVGPLLTTAWHQCEPYNSFCPEGDTDCWWCSLWPPSLPCEPTLVGCVATAVAQIMNYHEWPPSGVGEYSYDWDGDDTCGDNVGGGALYADFSDPYDWANMPDDCDGGCSPEQEDALAELCYEVGVAFDMDYGVCASAPELFLPAYVLSTYFRYDPAIFKEDRSEHTPGTWFSLIQSEINADRPMLYTIRVSDDAGHAIVCDGWRDTGGQNQVHMNYGWSDDGYDTWYTLDNLHGSIDPDLEDLYSNIKPFGGNIWLVRPDGTGDFPTIQAAVDGAQDGDIIELADGTFTGPGNRDIDFNGKAITLCSQGNDPDTCIIDCEGGGRGFYFHSGETPASAVVAVTIRNGCVDPDSPGGNCGGGILCESSSPTLTNCTITGNTTFEHVTAGGGGGIGCWDLSDPTITNCTIMANTASCGGGVDCRESSPTLSNCMISANTATYFAGAIGCVAGSSPTLTNCTITGNTATTQSGGGINCAMSSPTITNCMISGNTADAWGGGICCWSSGNPTITNCTITANTARCGGGIFCGNGNSLTITNCMISGNTADAWDAWGGGGIGCWDLSDPTITNCTITGNTARWGGGVYCNYQGSPRITNCMISANTASTWGGGICCFRSSPTLTNSTFCANSAQNQGGAIYSKYSGYPTLINSILWGNTPGEIVDEPNAVTTVSYSDVEGGWAGIGNIDGDPLFVDPDGPDDDPNTWEDNDYRLSAGSPCIDAGDNTAVPEDVADLDGDGDTAEPTPFDLDDNPRFADDPGMPDIGNGDPPIVDMGAYEFQCQTCFGDLDGDNDIDLADLAQLLSNYGMTAGAVYPDGDLDRDDDVDLSDLAALLAVYGTECG